MKIREIKHRPLFAIEFSEGVAFTEFGDSYEGVFNLEELTALGDHISAALQDHNPSRHHVDKVSDDVDTDPPDEYAWRSVYVEQDGHDCKETVDGG